MCVQVYMYIGKASLDTCTHIQKGSLGVDLRMHASIATLYLDSTVGIVLVLIAHIVVMICCVVAFLHMLLELFVCILCIYIYTHTYT